MTTYLSDSFTSGLTKWQVLTDGTNSPSIITAPTGRTGKSAQFTLAANGTRSQLQALTSTSAILNFIRTQTVFVRAWFYIDSSTDVNLSSASYFQNIIDFKDSATDGTSTTSPISVHILDGKFTLRSTNRGSNVQLNTIANATNGWHEIICEVYLDGGALSPTPGVGYISIYYNGSKVIDKWKPSYGTFYNDGHQDHTLVRVGLYREVNINNSSTIKISDVVIASTYTEVADISAGSVTPTTIDVAGQLANVASKVNKTKSAITATQYPSVTTTAGAWTTTASSVWTAGFFPTMLLSLFEQTSDTAWSTSAQSWLTALASGATTGDHDIAFRIVIPYLRAYLDLSNNNYLTTADTAANTLSNRYNSIVKAIRSWNSGTNGITNFNTIIDSAFTAPSLFFAYRNGVTNAQTMYDRALTHMQTMQTNHVRSDGSTHHVVEYNTSTGAVISQHTVQGYSDTSTWSRGHAWAMAGFIDAYRETVGNDPTIAATFLTTARRLSAYFVSKLPSDYIPAWDFDAPDAATQRDTSAAAIAAYALLELDKYDSSQDWLAFATQILKSLSSATYIAPASWSSVLQRATPSKPASSTGGGTTGTGNWPSALPDTSFTSLTNEATYLTALAAADPNRVRVQQIGTSAGGRPVRLVITGPLAQASEQALHDATTSIILGAHHGDEPAGRQAALIEMRLHAMGTGTNTVLWIPTVNPDGISANNRENANNVDLNRDWVNQTQPEIRAAAMIMRRLRPEGGCDLHEYDQTDKSTIQLSNPNAAHPNNNTGSQVVWEAQRNAVIAALEANNIPWSSYDILNPMPGVCGSYARLTGTIITLTETPRLEPTLWPASRRVTAHRYAIQAAQAHVAANGSSMRSSMDAVEASFISEGAAGNQEYWFDEMGTISTLTPPRAYDLSSTQFNSIRSTLDRNSINYIASGSNWRVWMNQPRQPLLGLMLDSRSDVELVAATPITSNTGMPAWEWGSTGGSLSEASLDGDGGGGTTPSPTINLGAIYADQLYVDSLGRYSDLTVQQPLAQPTFSPAAGTYSTSQNITITGPAGSSIYYTLNGATPTSNSTLYTGPITLSNDATVKAIAIQATNVSPIGVANYTIGITDGGTTRLYSTFGEVFIPPLNAQLSTLYSPFGQVQVPALSIPDPVEYPVPQPSTINSADVEWRFNLCESPLPGVDPTLPLTEITTLFDAADRKLNVAYQRSGDAGFKYPIFDRYAQLMFGGPRYCIQALRNREIVWSGPLASNDGDSITSGQGFINVKAVGWLELLTVRELREDVTYGAINAATGQAWYDWEIVFDLLSRVINYDTRFAPPIRKGTHVGTPYTRQFSWKKGTKISDCFRDLMEVEAGVNIEVNPVDRTLNVISWDTYANRQEIILGYNRPPFNLSKINWRIDFMAVRNRILGSAANVQSQLAEDSASEFDYGIFEETVNLSGTVNVQTLAYYVNAELSVKSRPIVYYTLTPYATSESVPALFKDFVIGDVLYFSADYGPIQENNRPVRVFSASIDIGDRTERLSSIGITMSGS